MIGLPRAHFARTDSTNIRARALAAAGAPHGTLVTAAEQTAGRGRQGRSWVAPAGRALQASLVLRALGPTAPLLPLLAGVAVCEACEALATLRTALKWPNDVWVDGRKLAGILVEANPSERWAVLGIGINVTTSAAELPPGATSLALATREAPSVEELLATLLGALEERLRDPADETLRSWRARDALATHPISWSGGAGTAAGIDDTGALLVDTDAGRLALPAGEVHLRSRTGPGSQAPPA